MSGYDIRIHIGETTRVHSTFGAYPLPPGLKEGDEVVLEAFEPGNWTVRNREGKLFKISMTCVGDAGTLDKPQPPRPACKPRVRGRQGPDFPDRR